MGRVSARESVICVIIVISFLSTNAIPSEFEETSKDGSSLTVADGPQHGKVAQRHQSPINIDSKNTVDINVGPLRFLFRPRKSDGGNGNIFKHGLGRNAEVKNIGHGYSVTSDDIRGIIVRGGGLDGDYRLAQFHFHWGKVDPKTKLRHGSEHTINGRRAPDEMHLVFHRDIYRSTDEAIRSGRGRGKGSDGFQPLAVVAVLIEDGDSIKTARPRSKPSMKVARRQKRRVNLFRKIANSLSKIAHSGETTKINLNNFHITDLLPDDTKHFWSYNGSLTTPNYDEVVAWRVMEKTIVLPKAILKKMDETVEDDNKSLVKENFRETQKLYGRKVYHNGKTS